MLLPIGIGLLAGGAWIAKNQRDKANSSPARIAERAAIYETAINTKLDPDKLRTLAAAFRDEGLIAEATMLEKRASLSEAPPDVKAQRTAVFRQALASDDVQAVREVADAFEALGASGACAKLRAHADGIEAAKNETKV